MIKTNAKDLFFKAALCFLANDDIIGAKRAIQNYSIDDPHFDSSRELELLTGLLEAIEQKSETLYIQKVGGFAKVTPMENVKNQLLSKIKEIYVPDESAGV